MVYLKALLPGIAVCKLCEANGDFADAEVRFGPPIHLRQHLDTKTTKGHREALKEHEARAAGRKGGGRAGPRARRMRGASMPTWTASSHSRARWFGSSSTALK